MTLHKTDPHLIGGNPMGQVIAKYEWVSRGVIVFKLLINFRNDSSFTYNLVRLGKIPLFFSKRDGIAGTRRTKKMKGMGNSVLFKLLAPSCNFRALQTNQTGERRMQTGSLLQNKSSSMNRIKMLPIRYFYSINLGPEMNCRRSGTR